MGELKQDPILRYQVSCSSGHRYRMSYIDHINMPIHIISLHKLDNQLESPNSIRTDNG